MMQCETRRSRPTGKRSGIDKVQIPRWSIAIYEGKTPFCMAPKHGVENPVLTYQHVSDVAAMFVADPFMVLDRDIWYMFFEVLNKATQNGEIGLATSFDGLTWTYRQIVLRESFHLSYPYVFQVDGQYYMVPETFKAGSISLYKATLFPIRWVRVAILVPSELVDPSLFYYQDSWWMFACPRPYHHDTLNLYHAKDLSGPWLPHSSNPLVAQNRRSARPAGRVLVLEDGVVRFTQDCDPRYGSAVRAFRISKLTTALYAEEEVPRSPVLAASGTGWNASGMHHIDPHQTKDGSWIACVDGLS
jgi:hypothetical protein